MWWTDGQGIFPESTVTRSQTKVSTPTGDAGVVPTCNSSEVGKDINLSDTFLIDLDSVGDEPFIKIRVKSELKADKRNLVLEQKKDSSFSKFYAQAFSEKVAGKYCLLFIAFLFL